MPLSGDYGKVQDLVEIKDIGQGAVIMKHGGLRQVLMVGGVNFSLKSEQEQNIIIQAYQDFLNGVNFSMQIIVHSRKINIERYVSRLDELREKETSPLLQDQIAEYQEFVRGFIKDNPIMVKTFFVVVPYAPIAVPGISATTNASFFDSLPFFGKKPEENAATKKGSAAEERAKAEQAAFEEAFVQLKQRVAQVQQGLFAIGLESVVLNDEQLVELYYNFYNPETVEKQETLAEKK
jgi:type IV secretory pathway VirB4 component